jgi:signal transduction histidine kinase
LDAEVEELARISVYEERLSVFRHDLRNRLGSIRNGAFYLKRKSEKSELWEGDPRFPRFFGLIEEEICAAETLLAEQASTDELMRRKLEPQMLEVGVVRGLEGIALPPGVSLETDYAQVEAKPLWSVEIALLVRCLVTNALEAMDAAPGTLRIRSGSRGGRAWLAVEDAGPGIPPEVANAALQPFRTEKPGHEGVGLNVVRRIVQRYDGSLEMRGSELGGLAVELGFP